MDAAEKIKEETTMRINTNLTAMNTFNQVTKNQNKISSAVGQLSSGSAITSAADNAAGLAISEKMRAQIRGLDKASSNAQDAISLVQTAEGALSQSTSILQRMRELAVQSSSDTNQNEIDRSALQDEFSQLQKELNDISKNTTFNKKSLLDGSLAKTQNNLTNASLANSSLTVSLGNAAAGNYNFSVATKLESAAVAGRQPITKELVTGTAASYFNNTAVTNKVDLGGSAAKSSVLNGNYTLSAKYGSDQNITVTATGDNGQSFTATIANTDLQNLATATAGTSALKLDMTFNAQADDAFKVTVGLTSNIASTETNFNTLADNISKMTVSIAGGVTEQAAQYGTYANLTGADSIKLESGMSSVTFENGVKVNFDTLTASAVDTANKATVDTAGRTVTGPAAADVQAAVVGSTAHIASSTFDFSNANGKIADGNFTVKDDGTGALTLTDAKGNTFMAAKNVTNATVPGAVDSETYTFHNANNTVSFTAAMALTAAAGAGNDIAAGADIRLTADLTGSSAYNLTGETAATGTAIMGGFTFTNDSTLANGSMKISSKTAGGTVTFTAQDSKGTKYTAQLASTALDGGAASKSVTNTLNFKSATGEAGFSVDLTTTNGTANQVTTFVDGDQYTTTMSKAGHNYTKVFGKGTDVDLSASTSSSFSVEQTKNAGLTFQVGANQGDSMTINIDRLDANYLGIASASVATQTAASAAVKSVDNAINQVSAQRAYLGAVQNRLSDKINNLSTSSENLTSAESQIRDVDMAKKMTDFTNANILSQASTAMLAQANSLPQSVLSLIGK